MRRAERVGADTGPEPAGEILRDSLSARATGQLRLRARRPRGGAARRRGGRRLGCARRAAEPRCASCSPRSDSPSWPPPTARRSRSTEVELLPPVPDPEKIICIGLNYPDHAAEARQRAAGQPDLLRQVRATRCAPTAPRSSSRRRARRSTTRPRSRSSIGRRAKDVSEAEALDHVAGYTLLNDLSARDLQFATPQWMPGKVFDGAAPCGPALVTPDEAGPDDAIGIALDLNGERMQEATTADLIFSIPQLVAHLSTPDDARARRHRRHRHAGRRRRRPRPARLAEAGRRDRRQLADSCGRLGAPDRVDGLRLASARCARERTPRRARTAGTRRRRSRTSASRSSWTAIVTAAASAATWTGVLRRGHERDRDRERRRQRADERLQELERRRLAPDAERRAASRLVAERAVVDLAQAAVGDEGDDRRPRDRDANATENHSAPRQRRSPSAVANSGASAAGPNLAAARERRRAPRAPAPSAARAAPRSRAPRSARRWRSRSSRRASTGRRARRTRAPSRAPGPRSPARSRRPSATQADDASRSKAIAAAWAAPHVGSQIAVPGEDQLERDVGEVVERAVDVALEVEPEREAALVERLAVGDPVGADHPGDADVDHVRVDDVERDPPGGQDDAPRSPASAPAPAGPAARRARAARTRRPASGSRK